MTTKEAIFYLEAILDDTLDHHDDLDAKRIEAVELAVEVLSRARYQRGEDKPRL